MHNISTVFSLIARFAFIYLGIAEWFQPTPDRIFSILCFVMVSCISIERDIVAIRTAFETLVAVKKELEKNEGTN
jgi:hypothetical protein